MKGPDLRLPELKNLQISAAMPAHNSTLIRMARTHGQGEENLRPGPI